MSEAVAICVLALKALTSARLAQWKGLPGDCTLDSVRDVFRCRPAVGAAAATSARSRASWLLASVTAATSPAPCASGSIGTTWSCWTPEILGKASDLIRSSRLSASRPSALILIFATLPMPNSDRVYPQMD